MSRRVITITTEPARLLVSGYRAGELLREAGMRPLYLGAQKAWTVAPHRLTDLAAFLDHRNVPYTVTESGEAA